MGRVLVLLFLLLPCTRGAVKINLEALPEFLRTDPSGAIVKPDAGAASAATAFSKSVSLTGARGGYVSFQLVVRPQPGSFYELSVAIGGTKNAVPVDLFREWFHFVDSEKRYYPDALIPMKSPYSSRFPEPDNHIANQAVQAFWVDVWIPEDAAPGIVKGAAVLKSGGKRKKLPIRLEVLPAVIPPEDAITIDHNSYGTSWMAKSYKPEGMTTDDFLRSDELFHLIHLYHRIFYEHRGIFHQLGYGHAGKVAPEFAPALQGSGRNKHIVNWDLYDRHYGPLLDGTAFEGTRRGPRPIPFVYLPLNPNWPADYLWWGEPGYETEFVNVVSEMEWHFRAKGWTKTKFEMFFNHKKRYMGFSWDGDETRFPKDFKFFREYKRLLDKAVPSDSPVQFVFRADSSWAMHEQFRELAGVLNMWVCAQSILGWAPDAVERLRKRGDIVWYYSGHSSITQPATFIDSSVVRAWLWGVNGFIHWLVTSPGKDPWFHSNGGSLALIYPGTRFGIRGPIPTIRLKLQRNCAQDLALLNKIGAGGGLTALRREVARHYNGTSPSDWWVPRPALADRPPTEWTNPDLGDVWAPQEKMTKAIPANAWQNVHDYIIRLVKEGQ